MRTIRAAAGRVTRAAVYAAALAFALCAPAARAQNQTQMRA